MPEPTSVIRDETSAAPGHFRDLDDLNHAISGSDLELIQLESGELDVQALSFDFDGLSVDRGKINRDMRIRGGLDAKRYSLAIFHPGARGRLNGFVVDPSSLLFSSPGLELDGHLRESYGWTSLVIPAAWIDATSMAARDTGFLASITGFRGLYPDAQKLQDLFRASELLVASRLQPGQGMEREEQLCLCLRDALGAVLSDFDAPDSKAISGTLSQYRTAQRAERYLRERGPDNVSVDDICAELRVSRRYLEYAFRGAFGTSPARYSRLLRLHQVRRSLSRPRAGTTVTTEATDHGFTHLGWFSTQYRALFGESPSSTLNRRAAPATNQGSRRSPPCGARY
jgi:AraC family ethanolamine operon transcriptional activator